MITGALAAVCFASNLISVLLLPLLPLILIKWYGSLAVCISRLRRRHYNVLAVLCRTELVVSSSR